MVEKSQESLMNFMKKQASIKVSKQKSDKKSTNSLVADKAKDKKKDGEIKAVDDEEMTEEEKIEEAKKESRGKLANTDQTEMLKKLFIESIAKYVLLITLLVVSAIGVIKLGPVFLEFLHGLFFRVLVGGAK